MNNERGYIKPIIWSVLYFLVFVVLMAGMIYYIRSSYSGFAGIFNNTIIYVIVLGTLVSVFGGITAYFHKGEMFRMVAGIVKVLFIIGYSLAFYYSLDITLTMQGITASISMPGIINLTLILLIIYALYFVLEYRLYKEDEKAKEMEDDEDVPAY